MGVAASRLVVDGSTIALSSGTTVLELARRLRDRRLTVITNALDVANALLDAREIELVVLGGVVLPGMHSMRGHLTEDALQRPPGRHGLHGRLRHRPRERLHDRAGARDRRRSGPPSGGARGRHPRRRQASSTGSRPGFMFGFEKVGTLVTDERVRPDFIEALEARGTKVVVGREGGLAADR